MSDVHQAPTLVLGLGSPLMGDDGVGLAALEALGEGWRFEPSVELRDGGTWGMNVLPAIEEAGRLVLLDAIRAGRAAGEVVVLERDAIPRWLSTKISPHQIDLREVLALAELRGTLPGATVAMGIEPARIEMTDALSAAVRSAVPALLERVVDRLVAWGHVVRGPAVARA